jgi:hypothetical protein
MADEKRKPRQKRRKPEGAAEKRQTCRGEKPIRLIRPEEAAGTSGSRCSGGPKRQNPPMALPCPAALPLSFWPTIWAAKNRQGQRREECPRRYCQHTGHFNNTLEHHGHAGHVIGWSSAGRVGFKGSRKAQLMRHNIAQDAARRR